MPDLEVGDVVWFDMNVPDNQHLDAVWVAEGPFVIAMLEDEAHYAIKRLNGTFSDGEEHWRFYRWRFRKDEFLTAAKKACQDG